MSISSAISNAQQKVADAYTAISNKGGTLPATQDLSNMPAAIGSINTGSGTSLGNFLVNTDYNISLLSHETYTLGVQDTEINIPDALYRAYRNNNIIKVVNLSALSTVSGNRALYEVCANCASLINVDLSALSTVSGSSGLNGAFRSTSITKVDLRNLTTISGTTALGYFSDACSELIEVDLSSLTTINSQMAFSNAFRGTALQSLSFPSLTSSSFGSYTNQFNSMLSGVTGCTVHFPSNLQSVIGSWSSVTSGFSGTNTTVLFDLPATT